ncbi:MAG: rod shape-determining protein MreC [Phycisphaerae bacterium]
MRLLRRIPPEGLLAVLICVSVAVALLGPDLSMMLRRLTSWAFAPLGDAGMYVVHQVKQGSGDLGEKTISGGEARRMRQKIASLEGQVENYRTALADVVERQGRQNALLRALYLSRRKLFGPIHPAEFPWELIPARVVSADSLPYGNGRTINAGNGYGVAEGNMVTTRVLLTNRSKAMIGEKLATISSQALVGEVVDSWAFGARLRLVTDRSFAVNALVHRRVDPNDPRKITVVEEGDSSEQTLTRQHPRVPVRAVGDNENGLICRDVPEIHNILPGDVVYVQEDQYYLPARVRIGKVDRVEKQLKNPSFVTLHVAPHARLSAVRDVYVVVPSKSWSQAVGEEN